MASSGSCIKTDWISIMPGYYSYQPQGYKNSCAAAVDAGACIFIHVFPLELCLVNRLIYFGV
jgi:hypothetical protein